MRPLLFLLLLSFLVACEDDSVSAPGGVLPIGTAPDEYEGPITRILEDTVHSNKMQSTKKLAEWDFAYGNMYAYHRFFKHLNQNGYEHDQLVEGSLTPELLAHYDILFINLMDVYRPAFTEEEIEAVRSWIEQGGGLFVIGDHTNVYRSSERLNPLLEPYGIQMRYETAIDQPPHSVSGLGWILVTDLPEHPVTEGIHEYSLQTGGPMDGPGSVGNTSSLGWGDYWQEWAPGFIGNWTKDEGEPSGPQSVMQAVSYGEGGVFVAGDQNMFGDCFIWFLDNGGLALNAMEWLAHRRDEETRLRNRPTSGLNIHIDTRADKLSMATNGSKEHYTFYCDLNRVQAVSAHASRYAAYFLPDVNMVVEPKQMPDATSLGEIAQVLGEDGQLMLIVHPGELSDASVEFLAHLDTDLGLVDGNDDPVDLSLGSYDASPLLLPTTLEPLRSDTYVLPECAPITCPGHAVISAVDEQGEQCDLVCEYQLGPGRFVLVLGGLYIRDKMLGDEHATPTTNIEEGVFSRAGYFFTMALTDILLDY